MQYNMPQTGAGTAPVNAGGGATGAQRTQMAADRNQAKTSSQGVVYEAPAKVDWNQPCIGCGDVLTPAQQAAEKAMNYAPYIWGAVILVGGGAVLYAVLRK